MDESLQERKITMFRHYIIRPSGNVKQVKNLGWLRRHSKNVVLINLRRLPNSLYGEAKLTAQLDTGIDYVAYFQSWTVAKAFISRPMWKNVDKCLIGE